MGPASVRLRALGRSSVGRSAAVFGIRFGAIGLTFVTTIVLARILDLQSYGEYAWALSWVTVLRLVVSLGYDKLVVREVAILAHMRDTAAIRNLLRYCSRSVLSVSAAAVVCAATVGFLVSEAGSLQFLALVASLVALPLMGSMTMRASATQGFSEVLRSRVPEDVVYPISFLVFIAISYSFAPASWLNSVTSALIRDLALLLAVIAAILGLRRNLPDKMQRPVTRLSRKRRSELFRSSVPLVVIGSANILIIEFGTIAIGSLIGSEAAAGYSVATRIAFTLTIAEFAVNQVLAPDLATSLANGASREELKRKITRASRLVFSVASLGTAIILIFAPSLMAVFGQDYVRAAPELRAVAAAWLINMGAGPCGLLLIMGGRERDAAIGLATGAAVSIPATLLLTAWIGPVGAGLSAALAMLLWNTMLAQRCWKIWSIDTTPLGIRGWGSARGG